MIYCTFFPFLANCTFFNSAATYNHLKNIFIKLMAYKVTNIKHAGVIAVFLLMISRNCKSNYLYIEEIQ